MQIQHYIIAIGMGLGFLALTYYIRKALVRAKSAGYEAARADADQYRSFRIQALSRDLADLTNNTRKAREALEKKLAEAERRLGSLDSEAQQMGALIRTSTLTNEDHTLLLGVASTLDLASRTWRGLPGAEPVFARSASQQEKITQLAARVLTSVNLTAELRQAEAAA